MTSIWLNDLALAAHPEILGVRLPPLRLGHIRLLKLAESPLLDGGPVEPGQLALALQLCARPVSEGVAFLQNARAQDFAEWAARLPSATDYAAARAQFDAWFAECARAPEAWRRDGEPQAQPGSPWWERIHWSLVVHGHLERAAAWEVPLQEALRFYAVTGEMMGGAELVKEEDQDEASLSEPKLNGVPESEAAAPGRPEKARRTKRSRRHG